jgi:hypothetical protein
MIFQNYLESSNPLRTEEQFLPDILSGEEGETTPPEIFQSEPERMALFILAGQSNMSGRGVDFPQGEVDPRVFVFGNDYRWRQASEPIDDPTDQVDIVSEDLNAGYSPAMGFALATLEQDPQLLIGLIPCAKGSSSIYDWQRDLSDQALYGSCLKRAKAASTAGRIRGILFFQGEADAVDGQLYPEHRPDPLNWSALFTTFMEDFRRDLSDPSLPVVFAQLGTQTAPADYPNWDLVKRQQEVIQLPGSAMIKTEDLPLQDEVHFTSESYRIIGRRFSDAYWSLVEDQP